MLGTGQYTFYELDYKESDESDANNLPTMVFPITGNVEITWKLVIDTKVPVIENTYFNV